MYGAVPKYSDLKKQINDDDDDDDVVKTFVDCVIDCLPRPCLVSPVPY